MIKKKNSIRIVLITLLILLVPFIAMQFSDDVKWSLFDFIVIGSLLIGAGLLFELLTAKAGSKNRIIIGGLIGLAVLLAWVELAVGIFGSPISGS